MKKHLNIQIEIIFFTALKGTLLQKKHVCTQPRHKTHEEKLFCSSLKKILSAKVPVSSMESAQYILYVLNIFIPFIF
jgi:hypothetical protein